MYDEPTKTNVIERVVISVSVMLGLILLMPGIIIEALFSTLSNTERSQDETFNRVVFFSIASYILLSLALLAYKNY